MNAKQLQIVQAFTTREASYCADTTFSVRTVGKKVALYVMRDRGCDMISIGPRGSSLTKKLY